MQRTRESRSNRERSDATRNALIAAARGFFVEHGYAETSTPQIAAAAGITRGALYHHFEDKRDLFRAVVQQEARALAREIEAAAPADASADEALLAGSAAYLDAMTASGRTRLLLVEGPAVLGAAEMDALDEANAGRTLRQGLKAAMAGSRRATSSVPALAVLLSAAFDRAALAIESGADPEEFRSAMVDLVGRVVGADDVGRAAQGEAKAAR